jgi:hypothetical protein
LAYAGSCAGHEDQASKVRSALVAESASGIDERGNAISLKSGSCKRRAPAGGGGGSLLRLEEFFVGVCGLGAVVGITEEGSQDGEGGSVGEHGTKSDSRWLDRWKI